MLFQYKNKTVSIDRLVRRPSNGTLLRRYNGEALIRRVLLNMAAEADMDGEQTFEFGVRVFGTRGERPIMFGLTAGPAWCPAVREDAGRLAAMAANEIWQL